MRVFTREQMNHLDIDQAFAAHTHNSKNNSTPIIPTKSFFNSDNLIIVLLILLLLIESKDRSTPPTS